MHRLLYHCYDYTFKNSMYLNTLGCLLLSSELFICYFVGMQNLIMFFPLSAGGNQR